MNKKNITCILIITVLFSRALKPIESGKDVIKKLEELSYFKYADADKIARLKFELLESFDSYKVL